MKKIFVFLLGCLTGIVITILILFIIGKTMRNSPMTEFGNIEASTLEDSLNGYGPSFFKEPGETFDFKSIKVFQVLDNGAALAFVGEKMEYTGTILYTGMTVLIYDRNALYYDDQIVKLSGNKVFKQIGIFRYPNKENDVLTVPIVSIFDNE